MWTLIPKIRHQFYIQRLIQYNQNIKWTKQRGPKTKSSIFQGLKPK